MCYRNIVTLKATDLISLKKYYIFLLQITKNIIRFVYLQQRIYTAHRVTMHEKSPADFLCGGLPV